MKCMKAVLALAGILAISSCNLFDVKTLPAPISVSAVATVGVSGSITVTTVLDYSGNIYPANYNVHYNTSNDFSTAAVSAGHAGTARVDGLSSGATYYVWVVAYGTWAGTTVYSSPTQASATVTTF